MPFNIGPGELIIVLIIALIVVGPGKLPDVGSALGKSIREFRKAATDVKESTSLEPAASAPGAPATQPSSTPPTPAAAGAQVPQAVGRRSPPAPWPPAPPCARRDRDRDGPGAACVRSAAGCRFRRRLPGSPASPDVAEPVEAWPAEVTPVDEQPTPSA